MSLCSYSSVYNYDITSSPLFSILNHRSKYKIKQWRDQLSRIVASLDVRLSASPKRKELPVRLFFLYRRQVALSLARAFILVARCNVVTLLYWARLNRTDLDVKSSMLLQSSSSFDLMIPSVVILVVFLL